MKKVLFAISATVIAASTAFAQTIPNNSFEIWETDTSTLDLSAILTGTQPDTFPSNTPTNWTTSNVISASHLFHQKEFAYDTTDSYDGTHAIALRVDSVTIPVYNQTLTVPGFVINGTFPISFSQFAGGTTSLTALAGAGTPISGRKEKLVGYYKYAPVVQGHDSLAAIAVLKSHGQPVATATFFSSTPQSSYIKFEAPFVYTSCEEPDSVVILLCASNPYLFQSLLAGGTNNLPIGSIAEFDSIAVLDTTLAFSIPPIAVDDHDTTTTGTAISIPVAANDQECAGNPLTVSLLGTTSVRGGSLVLNGDSIVYTPTITTGQDTFRYLITAVSGTDTGTVYVVVTAPTAIRNIENTTVAIYPNPAQNVLNISVNSKEVSKAVITDILGKTVAVKEITADKTPINTSSLENGLYIVTLFNANGKAVYATKFVEAK